MLCFLSWLYFFYLYNLLNDNISLLFNMLLNFSLNPLPSFWITRGLHTLLSLNLDSLNLGLYHSKVLLRHLVILIHRKPTIWHVNLHSWNLMLDPHMHLTPQNTRPFPPSRRKSHFSHQLGLNIEHPELNQPILIRFDQGFKRVNVCEQDFRGRQDVVWGGQSCLFCRASYLDIGNVDDLLVGLREILICKFEA